MSRDVQVESHAPDETRALGKRLGAALGDGELVLLQGSFGAGKTVLVQGIAAGMGIDDQVTSPSFVLMVEHVGARRLVHVDFFRIERADAELLAGVEDYLDGRWVVAIEWPDWIPEELAGEATRIRIEPRGDVERLISVDSPNPAVLQAARTREHRR